MFCFPSNRCKTDKALVSTFSFSYSTTAENCLRSDCWHFLTSPKNQIFTLSACYNLYVHQNNQEEYMKKHERLSTWTKTTDLSRVEINSALRRMTHYQGNRGHEGSGGSVKVHYGPLNLTALRLVSN
jgi:hypothetical protein